MKKQFLVLLIIAILTTFITGCGGTTPGENSTVATPLSLNSWPTARPTIMTGLPTPFPKATIPTVAPTKNAPAKNMPAANIVNAIDLNGGDVQATIREQLMNTLINELTTVAVGVITKDEVIVRQGPADSYDNVTKLQNSELVGILGTNPAADWVYSINIDLIPGWLPVDSMHIAGDMEKAPVLPVNPIAAILARGSSSSSSSTTTAPVVNTAQRKKGDSFTEPLSPQNIDLTAINTALIQGNGLDLRRGAGQSYGFMGTLPADEQVIILALNQQADWVLVKTAISGIGWLPLNGLSVNGSLADAPRLNFTAWVNSNGLAIRDGAGIFYDKIGLVNLNNMVIVLGFNQGRNWVLIKPISGGGQGWISREFLTFNEPAADIPQAPVSSSVGDNQAEIITDSQTPITNGILLFQLSSGGDIMVINAADGSGLRRLTNGIDPVLSSDGKIVAFTRWNGDEQGSLWTINIDGSNERFVTGNLYKAKGADWSPDKTKIVLNYQHGGRLVEKTECFNLASGSPPRPPRNASTPIIKQGKGGKRLLCWVLPPDPHWGLRVVNMVDGNGEDLFGGLYAFRPAWDPTQSWRIISDSGSGLLETDTNRDYHKNITDNSKDSSPVFSPEGRYLVVTSNQQEGYNIFRMNSHGGERVRLTKTPFWVTVGPDRVKLWDNTAPSWSPDGLQIAFLTNRTGRWEIWLMNRDGSNQRSFFSEEVNKKLNISYNFMDERVLSWR